MWRANPASLLKDMKNSRRSHWDCITVVTLLCTAMSAASATAQGNATRTCEAGRMARHAGRPGEVVTKVNGAHQGPSAVLQVPARLLMGPGPSNAHPRILAAQSLPLLGHMHPPFIHIMDEIAEGLRYLFQTDSKYTCLISGTGHAGMEAAIANTLEPGEKIIVGVNGIWGERVSDLASRYGGDVIQLKAEAGKTFSYEELKAALIEHKPAVLFLVQGESSTGTHQSLAGLGEICQSTGTLLVVDTVAALGGVPLFADEWKVDCIYSGSQKCLSAPPGASPFFMSERAIQKLRSRSSKVATYNLDLNLIGEYWGWYKPGPRWYHHTAPTSTYYAMREALAIVAEEGLEAMWDRHLMMHEMLWEGLRGLGLEPFVENPADRLIIVNTIKVPEGVDWMALVKNAMDKYSVEIAGGLGPSAGKAWRVGLMGFNARPQNVKLVIEAFRDGLAIQGWKKQA